MAAFNMPIADGCFPIGISAPHQPPAPSHFPGVLVPAGPCAVVGGRGVTVVLREGCGDGGDDLGLKVGTGLASLEELASDGREEDV